MNSDDDFPSLGAPTPKGKKNLQRKSPSGVRQYGKNSVIQTRSNTGTTTKVNEWKVNDEEFPPLGSGTKKGTH